MLARVPASLRLAALAVIAAAAPRTAIASGDAGFEITVGEFRVQVFYGVANEYPDGADRAVLDPRVALFTIASTLQANGEAFSAIPHTLRFDLLVRDGFAETILSVVEDPQESATKPTTVVLHSPLERDVAAEVLSVACGRYPGACRRPARATLDLYRCPDPRCAGRIRFGAFPSDSLKERFALAPSTPRAAPIRVGREQMTRWFEPLGDVAPGSPSTARAWYLPARATISRLSRGICHGCEGNRDVPACSDFSLTPEQVRALLARARSITPWQSTHEFDWAPCVVRGSARWDRTEVAFEISALLVASLRFGDGSELMLACDGTCEDATTRAAPRAARKTRPAGARAPARRPDR